MRLFRRLESQALCNEVLSYFGKAGGSLSSLRPLIIEVTVALPLLCCLFVQDRRPEARGRWGGVRLIPKVRPPKLWCGGVLRY